MFKIANLDHFKLNFSANGRKRYSSKTFATISRSKGERRRQLRSGQTSRSATFPDDARPDGRRHGHDANDECPHRDVVRLQGSAGSLQNRFVRSGSGGPLCDQSSRFVDVFRRRRDRERSLFKQRAPCMVRLIFFQVFTQVVFNTFC